MTNCIYTGNLSSLEEKKFNADSLMYWLGIWQVKSRMNI